MYIKKILAWVLTFALLFALVPAVMPSANAATEGIPCGKGCINVTPR